LQPGQVSATLLQPGRVSAAVLDATDECLPRLRVKAAAVSWGPYGGTWTR
jgi:hypothetical protein